MTDSPQNPKPSATLSTEGETTPDLQASPSALSDEDFVRASLATLEPIAPSAELLRRVAEIPIRSPQRGRGFWPFEKVFQPVLGLLAAAALGLVVGAQDDLWGLEGAHHTDTTSASAQTSAGVAMGPVAVPANSDASSGSAGRDTAHPDTAHPDLVASEPQLKGADLKEASAEPELSELEQELLIAFGTWEDSSWLDEESL